MTFPGAAYPFGAVRLTPKAQQGMAYGGYRYDRHRTCILSLRLSPALGVMQLRAANFGVSGDDTKSTDRDAQESHAGYYKVPLSGGGNEVVLKAAASSPRTATMRLT